MRTSTLISAAKGKTTTREVVFWVFSLILVSQFGFHFLVGSSLRSEDKCIAGSASSPHCTEVILFKKWQADDLAGADTDLDTLDELLLEQYDDAEVLEPLALGKQSELDGGAVDTWSSTSMPEETAMGKLLAVLAVARPDLAAWVSTSEAPDTLFIPEVTRASEPVDEQASHSQVAADDGMSDWGRDLIELQKHLETEMYGLRSFRNLNVSQMGVAQEKAKEVNSTHMTKWSLDLEALQHRLEDRAANITKAKVARRKVMDEHSTERHRIMEEHSAERSEHIEKRRRVAHAVTDDGSQRDAINATGSTETSEADIEKPLMDRIFELGRELCSDPARIGRTSCIQFLDLHKNESRTTENTVNSAVTEGRISEQLLAETRARESRYESEHTLNWPAVRDWQKSSAKLRASFPTGMLAVGRDELRHAKWAGMIPKVACISVLPSGREAKYQIKYLVNNFRLQTYEGPRQLVLVYNHQDGAAKKLVDKYADGVYIRGAAARGEGEFATVAFRFGAYVAPDADIIARWDFNAWHHPDRLSMQVRALAHKVRPVSRLVAWTLRNGTEDIRSTPDESLGEASLVGEKAWMSEHWHPMLKDETATLTSAHLRYLVQLDMPGLVVYSHTGAHLR